MNFYLSYFLKVNAVDTIQIQTESFIFLVSYLSNLFIVFPWIKYFIFVKGECEAAAVGRQIQTESLIFQRISVTASSWPLLPKGNIVMTMTMIKMMIIIMTMMMIMMMMMMTLKKTAMIPSATRGIPAI